MTRTNKAPSLFAVARRLTCALIILTVPFTSERLTAQWLNNPTPGVPRKADGKVDMTAPAPRMANGKPDLSGLWMTAEPNRGNGRGTQPPAKVPDEPGDQKNITASRQMKDIGVDVPGGLPYQPWLIPIVKERTANEALDDPHIRCLPDNFLRAY